MRFDFVSLGFDSQDDIDDSKEKQFTDKVNEKLQNIISEMRVCLGKLKLQISFEMRESLGKLKLQISFEMRESLGKLKLQNIISEMRVIGRKHLL